MFLSFLLVLAIFEVCPVLMTSPATMVTSDIYKKVKVTEGSFNNMMINNFLDDDLAIRRYGVLYFCIKYLLVLYIFFQSVKHSVCIYVHRHEWM